MTAVQIALLRGINVGGKHRLPMKALAALFTAAGAEDVRTYLQSGNVAFAAPAKRAPAVLSGVRAGLLRDHGFDVPILSRPRSQLGKLLAACPFDADDPTRVHVGFLERRPAAGHRAALDALDAGADEIVVRGTQFFLSTPNGMARTKFTSAFLDRAFGCVTTVRNWRTASALLEL